MSLSAFIFIMQNKEKSYSELNYYTYQELLLDIFVLTPGVFRWIPWQISVGAVLLARLFYGIKKWSWKRTCKKNTVLSTKEQKILQESLCRYFPESLVEIKPYGFQVLTNGFKLSTLAALQKRFPGYAIQKFGKTIQISVVRRKREAELFKKYAHHMNLTAEWYGERIPLRRTTYEVMGVDLNGIAVLIRDIHTGKVIELP